MKRKQPKPEFVAYLASYGISYETWHGRMMQGIIASKPFKNRRKQRAAQQTKS